MVLARQPPVDAAKQRIAWTIVAQSQLRPRRVRQGGARVRRRRASSPAPTRSCAPISPSASRPRSTSRARRSRRRRRRRRGRRLPARGARRAGFEDPLDRAVRRGAPQLIDAQAVGSRHRGARRLPPRVSRRASCRPTSTRKLAVAYTEGGPRRARRRRSSSASPPIRRKTAGVQREALLQSADLYDEGQQHAEGRRDAREVRRRESRRPSPMRWRRASGSPTIAGKSGDIVKRDALVSRDREGRCAGGRRAHRSHAVSRRRRRSSSLAQPARDAFRGVRLDGAAEEEPGRQAQGAGCGAGRRTSRRPNTTLPK